MSTRELNRLFDFIKSFIDKKGYAPSLREICAEFNYKSTSTASNRLKELEDLGKICITSNKSRAIVITDYENNKFKYLLDNDLLLSVPLLGKTAAGLPIDAIENHEDQYYFSKNLFNTSGELYLLKIEGRSMIDAGIDDGDLIVVKKQNTANNGEIIVALVEDDCATVKRFVIKQERCILRPENKDMMDIYPTQLTILGIVVGCIKTNIN